MLVRKKVYLVIISIFVSAILWGSIFLYTSKIIFVYCSFISVIAISMLMHTIRCPNCKKKVSGFPNIQKMLFKGYNHHYSNIKEMKCASCGYDLRKEK